MAVFPTITVDKQNVKFRHGERYVSEAANRSFLGIPRGVYYGFIPTFENNILTLAPDPVYGVSQARLTSSDDPMVALDVVTTEVITLDFTGHSSYPADVVLTAAGAIGSAFSAQIVTQPVGAINERTVIRLGVVTAANTISIDQPSDRSSPFAYASAPLGYGFMQSGSVEDLIAAVSLVQEVENARTDLTGFTHPSLRERLDADAAGPAIADRLGKELRTIVSEDITLPSAPTGSINVSRSFSALYRSNTPVENIQGFASEERDGAITGGTLPAVVPAGALSDSERNVCMVIDTTTERRIQNASRVAAYGRLTLSEVALTGTLTFVATSDRVSGAGTDFPNQVEVGDIVQDTVDDYYEVAAIPQSVTGELLATIGGAPAPHDLSTTPLSNPTAITPGTVVIDVVVDGVGADTIIDDGAGNLTSTALTAPGTISYATGAMTGVTVNLGAGSTVVAAYDTVPTEIQLSTSAATSGASAGLLRRRFTLSFYVRAGIATETALALEGGPTLRFFFPVWDTMQVSQFDYLPYLFKNADAEPVIDATTSLSGRALVAPNAVDGKAGAINSIEDTGNPLPDGYYHTLNFLGAYTTGGGVANITQRGPTGPTGPDASGGPTGPTGSKGPQGPGFEKSSGDGTYALPETPNIPQGTSPYLPGTTWTKTWDFGATHSMSDILFATTGISKWNPNHNSGDDRFEIVLLEKISSTTLRVTGYVPLGSPNVAGIRFLFNAGGLD